MSLLIALGLAGTLIQSAVAPPRAAMSGQVLEDTNRTPVAGARVMLIPSESGRTPVRSPVPPLTAITAHDGRYEFEDLEAGRYRIMVQKAGFALPNDAGMPEVNLEAGERREGVDVTLQKGAVIVGRVLDETGEPLVEARVMAMRKPAVPQSVASIRRDPVLPFPAGPGTQTNDLGEFRLFSLPPGEYYVQAMPRHDFDEHARATTLLPTYFPSTSDAAAAQPISLAAGQTWGDVVIRMVSVPAFSVSGVVLDEAGRPVVNALVKLVADEPTRRPMFMMGRWAQARTGTSGRFTIANVTNGTYTLLAIAPLVTSGPANGRTGGANGGGFTSFGLSGGIVGGTIGAGVMMETSNGITTEYRDDTATRVPITVNDANVSGLEVIVRPAGR